MNIKRLLSVAAFMLVVTLNFSCEQTSASESDEFYGLDKEEVIDEDI